jgi:DNA-binding response OmpR family regulator
MFRTRRYHRSVKSRVLLVEHEEAISEPLAEHLARERFAPEVAPTIALAGDALDREAPDLILLDDMLPDGDGRDFCREIRKRSDEPNLMLMARGEEIDKILGPELGADDYVVKPFSAPELVARIRARADVTFRAARTSEDEGAGHAL